MVVFPQTFSPDTIANNNSWKVARVFYFDMRELWRGVRLQGNDGGGVSAAELGWKAAVASGQGGVRLLGWTAGGAGSGAGRGSEGFSDVAEEGDEGQAERRGKMIPTTLEALAQASRSLDDDGLRALMRPGDHDRLVCSQASIGLPCSQPPLHARSSALHPLPPCCRLIRVEASSGAVCIRILPGHQSRSLPLCS